MKREPYGFPFFVPADSFVQFRVFQIVMGPWPMHEVVPRAVSAAVRMLTTTCRMVFQVSLFFMVMDFLGVNRELIGS